MSSQRRSGSLLKKTGIILLVFFLAIAAFLFAQRNKIKFAAEAYLYGVPLVLIDLTRQQTHQSSPINELIYLKEFPDEKAKVVVRPNLDTLYTTSFLYANDGPWVLTIGASLDRYNSVSLLDAWTNVIAAPGTRNQGTNEGRYLLVPTQWQGTAPSGMEIIRLPTNLVWLIGRTQTNSKKDYAHAHRIQNTITLQHLKDWSTQTKSATHGKIQASSQIDPVPIVQLQNMPIDVFFTRLMTLMVDNPPNPKDQELIQRMAQHGLVVGQEPKLSLMDRLIFSLGRHIADRMVMREVKHNTDGLVNGWKTPPKILGNYEQNYPLRAGVAMVGLGANLPIDSIYPSAQQDATGQMLNGKHRYRIHFTADQLPPAQAFWSLTAYGDDDFLIPNTYQRYAIGDRDSLVYNSDGSLTLIIQADPPADTSNWLPVAKDQDFLLMMRLYLPKENALSGEWTMPAIERLD